MILLCGVMVGAMLAIGLNSPSKKPDGEVNIVHYAGIIGAVVVVFCLLGTLSRIPTYDDPTGTVELAAILGLVVFFMSGRWAPENPSDGTAITIFGAAFILVGWVFNL